MTRPTRMITPVEAACFGGAVHYPAGTTLFREDDAVRQVGLLRSGVVKLLASNGGNSVLIAIRTSGWILGAAGALTGGRQLATAVAMCDCEIQSAAVHDFLVERKTSTALQESLLEMLAREVRNAHRRWTSLATGESRIRLEQLFVELIAALGEARADGSLKLRLMLSVTEIAELTRTSRQWTSKCLSLWARQGVLVRERGWFVAPPGSPLVARLSEHSP